MSEEFREQPIECVDCATTFMWTSWDQQRFASQDPPWPPPKRCRDCRRQCRDRFAAYRPTDEDITPGLGVADQVIECRDCATNFTWSANEQAFYRANDFTAPKRCAECRKWNREARLARESQSVEW